MSSCKCSQDLAGCGTKLLWDTQISFVHNMDLITKSPGLYHIAEQIFLELNHENLLQCEDVNKNWKNILDSEDANSRFWFKWKEIR